MPILVYFSDDRHVDVERELDRMPASFTVMRENPSSLRASAFGFSVTPALAVLGNDGRLHSCKQGVAVIKAYLQLFSVTR